MTGRAAGAQQQGMDEETVRQIHDFENSDLPERSKLALRFTEAWILHAGRTIDAPFMAELRAHFSDREIVELAKYVEYYEGAHKFNFIFDVDPPAEGIYAFTKIPPPKRLRSQFEELKAERARRDGGAALG